MRQPEFKVESQAAEWDPDQRSPWTGTGMAVSQLQTRCSCSVAEAGTKGPGLCLN